MTRTNGVGQHRAERRRCTAMIKIRYRNASEFSPGLHAAAERHGRTVTIALVPGLTAEERDAAVRRLRQSGRIGRGPRLPAVPLAFALSADRIRTAIAQARAVFRTHPAGTTGPVMLISAGAIAFLVLSAVSIRILREPRGPAGPSASGPIPAASATAGRTPGRSRHRADDPAGSQSRVLTAALTVPDPLPLPASPGPTGIGPGAEPGTGTGSTGSGTGTGAGAGTGTGTGAGSGAGTSTGSGSGTGGAGTPVGVGSAPDPAAPGSGGSPVTVPVSSSAPAPSAPGSVPDPVPSSAPSPAPGPVSAPATPPPSASAPVTVSASVGSSVTATVSAAPSVAVSASGLPSVSAAVPVLGIRRGPRGPVGVAASVSRRRCPHRPERPRR